MSITGQPSAETAKDEGLPPIAPDFIEQDYPEVLDNIIPTRGYQMTPMVGLGGSAGCIQALTEFFKAMPDDSGMVFVVILHLSPSHHSTMPQLLARTTNMQVLQAENNQKVEPNHVYVIPPGKFLMTVNGHMKLVDMENDRGKRVAVDLFFRSLADTHGPHAAAIVLSGADGDGALGIKRIKERGGLTIAQDPDQAEHSSMPRTSIDTGMIDWVLDVAQMPHRLLEYHKTANRLKLPPEDGPPPVQPLQPPTADENETTLREILLYLRTRTGHDFSYYKRATIVRRIARRMQVNGIVELTAYMDFLRTHPGEAGALQHDLLVSVTNFFRDREVFKALEQYIPELFKNKTQADSVRVWVPACATGEEAYSIAMLLLEHARKIDNVPSLQVFACDLDEAAIQIARMGHYPETITADVSEERLRRYFVNDHRGYRVRRELREMVLFAVHDLLKDPPFSRMDFVSCRNLLIYLNRDAQQRALDTFHFTLNQNGLLLLGSAESLEDRNAPFRVVDKKHRIYAHQAAARVAPPIPAGPSSLLRIIEAQKAHLTPVVHGKRFLQDAAVPFFGKLVPQLTRSELADLHLRLVERYAPPSVIVNADHEIVHISEHASSFLKFAAGEPTMNLLLVVHPSLRIELRSAMYQAAEKNASVEVCDVESEIDGQPCRVRIRVSPAPDIATGYLLVVFEKFETSRPAPTSDVPAAEHAQEPAARHLERELERVKSHLRETVEQYEGSTEELKASNEELQAMNEELRSATEELETSREELQSINEELTTVNQELKGKVDELATANSDLQNLMASTAIPTVFLDRALSITLYTPDAAAVFHLIPGDIGRPLAHLKHKLDYPQLIDDAERVMRTLIPSEREVRDEDHWYLARIQPYRTLEDHIAGAVLTLVDVTERNRAIEALRESEERMRILIESANDFAIFTFDPKRRVDMWNKGAQAMFGYAENEILGQLADILFTPEDRAKGDHEREVRLAREEGRAANERWHLRKDGSIFYGSGSVMPLREDSGTLRGFVKIMRDLTETKRTQEALREHMDDLTRFNAAAVGRETRMIELKKEINDLCARLGEPARYVLDSLSEAERSS